MKEFDVFIYAVYNALGVGYQNALTRRELCQKLKCGDRALRKAIEELRRDYPILTQDDGQGYYLPETTPEGREDAAHWIRRQNRRIQSIKAAQSGALRFIGPRRHRREMLGQFSMFKETGAADG